MGIKTTNHFWITINNGGRKFDARISEWDKSFNSDKISELNEEDRPVPISISYECPGCFYNVGIVQVEDIKVDEDGNQYVILEDGCKFDYRRKELNCKICPLSRQYIEENGIKLVDSDNDYSEQRIQIKLIDPIEEGLMQVFLHQ